MLVWYDIKTLGRKRKCFPFSFNCCSVGGYQESIEHLSKVEHKQTICKQFILHMGGGERGIGDDAF